MLSISGVTKRYGKTLANDNISFAVGDGQIGILLGPNGAGKSTIIKCITGLLRFTGRIEINGCENTSLEAKAQLGYIPEMPAVYDLLTVEEHLEFIRRAYKVEDALGLRHQGIASRVYCMIGDGEINEGEIWEAAATASHYHLDNLVAFTDVNGLQNDAETKKVKDMLDIAAKWRAFGWNTLEINGHDFEEIFAALDAARECKGRPTAIISHTVKGKGVSFMENVVAFHGKTPSKEEYENGMKELEEVSL